LFNAARRTGVEQGRPEDGSVTFGLVTVASWPSSSQPEEVPAMPAIVLLGAQWGDEGKGKATDLMGSSVDYVVKYNGGNNAGHTIVIGDEKYALHLLPSGILTPGVVPVIANGVVIDLSVLFREIDQLEARGVDTSRLLVSANAHLITSYHQTVDKTTERFLGKARLGTTGRGIGPTYADKMSRVGIRVQDVFDEKILRQKIETALEQKNNLLVKAYNRRAIGVDEVVEELERFAERLRPMVVDSALVLCEALDAGRTVLLEGGQATMLDVDHGTYPFVTSSNPTAGGACTGSGIPPGRIDRVVAVVKAYTTRVGEGPFPTELLDADGRRLRDIGAEFGTTTGRPRRCGWFDAVVARFAARVNGVTDFVLTKLDVLTGWEQVPVCVAYEVDGVRHDEMPMTQTDFFHAKPVYEMLPGWSEDITGAKTLADLPPNAQAYVEALEEMSGAPMSAIGVGPGRDQTVQVRPLT
jgi:adenylosuccinate synthase